MTPSLTQGAVAQLLSRDIPSEVIEDFQPTLQLLSVKKVTPYGTDRYRLIYSDGEYHCQSILATKLNGYFESQNVTPKCILKLTQFTINLVQNKKLVITLGIEKLQDYSEKIGNPVRFDRPPSLTQGAVTQWMSGNLSAQYVEDFQPTLQLLSIQKVSSRGGINHYWLVYSNGEYHCQSALATQLNDYFESQNFTRKCIVKLLRCAIDLVQNERFLITLGIEKLQDYSETIGNPVRFDTTENSPNGGPSAMDVDPASTAPVAPPKARVHPEASGATNSLPADFASLHPIESLTPYVLKATICARITKKGEIRRWSNKHGHGKLLSVHLMDDTGEIRATGYNELVDDLYSTLEEGKAYWITNAGVYPEGLSSLSTKYEIVLQRHAKAIPCEDESAAPKVKLGILELSQLDTVDFSKLSLSCITPNGDL